MTPRAHRSYSAIMVRTGIVVGVGFALSALAALLLGFALGDVPGTFGGVLVMGMTVTAIASVLLAIVQRQEG